MNIKRDILANDVKSKTNTTPITTKTSRPTTVRYDVIDENRRAGNFIKVDTGTNYKKGRGASGPSELMYGMKDDFQS